MKTLAKLIVSVTLASLPATSQTQTPLLAIGDSLGEGVQSANSFFLSQPNTYANRFASQMGVSFQQPLLSTSYYAYIFSDLGRSRLNSTAIPDDIAVSGAATNNVLTTVANATPTTEYDLVLPPYIGMSQIQIVEQVKPKMVLAWVGNDDLTPLILNSTTLNTNTPTPLPIFITQYQDLVSRLKATGAQVVMANVPDLTKLSFLFDNNDLTRYTGTNYNLPAGSLTTLPTMVGLKLGTLSPAVLQNPGYVLDAAGVARIQILVDIYNKVILQTATSAGFPVVDVHALVDGLIKKPIVIEGITIGTHFNGGAFSLDGVHPSNIGYAIFANAFIAAANKSYNLNIPPISPLDLVLIFNHDPFIDFGGQGVVPGRPYTGLLESLGPYLGLSGGPGRTAPRSALIGNEPVTAAGFMRRFFTAKGMDPDTPWTDRDVNDSIAEMLGIKR